MSSNDVIKFAYQLGYRAKNNCVFSPKNKSLKLQNKKCYYIFWIRLPVKITLGLRIIKPILVHRFVAYQKYGDLIFDPKFEVRHLDGNSFNNCESNISYGTHSQNMLDIPKEKRIKISLNAASKSRIFTDNEILLIRKDRENGLTYSEIGLKYDISKGHAYYIINSKYPTLKL